MVMVDPSRKGCDKIVLLQIIAMMKPKRVVYALCKPRILVSDLKILDELGYKSVELQPMDMFSYTAHVECVVGISR